MSRKYIRTVPRPAFVGWVNDLKKRIKNNKRKKS